MSLGVTATGPTKVAWTRAAAHLSAMALLFGAVASCAGLGTPETQRTVAGSAVTIAAPEGYCIDPHSTRDRRNGTFLLVASCLALGAQTEVETLPVAMTALVSDALEEGQNPGPTDLQRYLLSAPGRAILSTDGDAESVKVLQSEIRGEVLYLKLRDLSENRDATMALETWRAVFPMNGRIVALSAQTVADQPVSSRSVQRLLRRFVAATLTANTAATV